MKIMSKTLAVSLCSAIMLGVVGVPGALADSNKKTSSSSSATATTGLTYVVAKNDSLTGIASKAKVKFNDLLAVNGFKATSVILPGQVIKLPDAAVAVVPSANSSAVSTVAAAPTVASGATYTVVKNDSLSGIASKVKVSLSSFLAVNDFTKKSVILPGQVVKLPAGAIVASTTAAAAVTPAAPSRLQAVLDFARAQIGKPYAFATAGPNSFDCSGLTKAAFAQAKISLPHQSLAQSKLGTAVDWKSTGVQAGDLVFTYSTKNTTQISHVGVAISATQWIEAPYTGGAVRISSLPSASKIQAVRRVL